MMDTIIDFLPKNWEKTLEERLGKHRNTIRNILREDRIDEYSDDTIELTRLKACELIIESRESGIEFVTQFAQEKELNLEIVAKCGN